ncbi:MAG TPA: ABC transporter substrate-binding protein [Geothrix sp.]|nr:ABC transporter substrate-binding protein [Geothrix sp.]
MPGFLRSISCMLALAMGNGCGKPPPEPLQLATNVWPGYEPLYLARHLGALDPRSFRLVEMASSSDCMRALKAGRVAAAALTLDEVFTLLQEGVDLQIVLIMDVSNGADALLGRPDMKTLAALKGHRVGVEQTAVGAYLLSRALDQAGLRPEDIVVVPMTEGAHEARFLDGSVDAVVTFEPSRTRLMNSGAKVLFDSSRIPNEIVDVLVFRGEVARARPEAMAMVRNGWFKAQAHLHQRPQEACRQMALREGLDSEAFRKALEGLSFPDEDADRRMRAGELLPPARRLADLMHRQRLLAHPVDPARLLSRHVNP